MPLYTTKIFSCTARYMLCLVFMFFCVEYNSWWFWLLLSLFLKVFLFVVKSIDFNECVSVLVRLILHIFWYDSVVTTETGNIETNQSQTTSTYTKNMDGDRNVRQPEQKKTQTSNNKWCRWKRTATKPIFRAKQNVSL